MSFSRVKPDAWALNEKLTSAQQNQLDIDHTLAVDKTGDSILGTILLSGASARIHAGASTRIVMQANSIFEVQGSANATFASGSFLTINSGASLALLGTVALFGGGSFSVSSGATVTFEAGASLTINCDMSVNGKAYFSDDLTCYKNLIMDGNSIPGDRKLRIKDAVYLDIEEFSKLRVLDGAEILLRDGSDVTHESGSSETYDSGSILEQESGSSWNLKGGVTFTPTCTAFFSVGGTTSFASTPTFFNGYTVSAGTTAIAGTLNITATANLSGTTNHSGAANFSGTTTIVGAAGRLKLTGRVVTRQISLANAIIVAGASYDYVNDRMNLGTGGIVAVDLKPPNNGFIEEVQVVWSGSGNITTQVMQNSVVVGGPVTSTSAGTITMPVNSTALTDQATYRLVFFENASNTPTLRTVKVLTTVTEYDDG